MRKLFLLLLIGATLPAVAQTSKELLYVIDASYLKQGSTYGQLGLHFNCYDSNSIALSAGIAGNFRSENKQLIAIPEAQFSAWIRADNERGGLIIFQSCYCAPNSIFHLITSPLKQVYKSSYSM